jgi:tripartite-type tricarboxylate transporter receptor subunit TctC
MNRRQRLLTYALAAVALACFGTASAQAPGKWPGKPVRLVAVFPPGGSVDQVARLLGAQLAQQLGQQFVIDNKGGASGSIGTADVARASPDGHTFAVVFDTHAVNPSLLNLPFDTVKDLASVSLIGTASMAIVAHTSQPYRDFRDVIAAAKAKPGSVAYGSIGTGSLGHLAMVQIANQMGVEMTHVPYRGGGPLMNDAVAGQLPLAIGTVFLVTPHVKGGKLRALAVTSGKADGQLSGVKPLVEQGVPGFQALAWWGVFAPAATPPAIVRKMSEEIGKALNSPAVAEKLRAQGMDVLGGGPEELDRFVRSEITRWGKVVRENKIKAGD